MEGREFRRSMTLSNQLSSVNSSNLRDLLKVRDDDDGEETLDPAIPGDKPVSSSGRTLFDIIREEQNAAAVSGGANTANWRSFKDCLRLRRAGAAFTTGTTPISDPDLVSSVHSNPNPNLTPNRLLPRSLSIRPAVDQAAPRPGFPAAPSTVDEPSPSPTPAAEEQPVRVSLMALLEQTDRHWGSGEEEPLGQDAAAEGEEGEGGDGDDNDNVDDEEDDGEGDSSGGGGIYRVCCVCMVRHKGAAFIPCGHTFCRLCSRELWVSRGNCPLCNGFILEILDIF